MKTPISLATAGLALGLLGAAAGGCTTTRGQTEPAAQRTLEKREAAARNATESLQRFERQRQEYRVQAENTLNDLESRIADLKAQAPHDPAQREAHTTVVSQLEAQLSSARSDLMRLGHATAEDWSQRQETVEESINLVKSAYEAAAARLAH
jgi:hypothetical protein